MGYFNDNARRGADDAINDANDVASNLGGNGGCLAGFYVLCLVMAGVVLVYNKLSEYKSQADDFLSDAEFAIEDTLSFFEAVTCNSSKFTRDYVYREAIRNTLTDGGISVYDVGISRFDNKEYVFFRTVKDVFSEKYPNGDIRDKDSEFYLYYDLYTSEVIKYLVDACK